MSFSLYLILFRFDKSVLTYVRTSAIHVSGCEMSHLLVRRAYTVFIFVLDIHVMVNWHLSKKVSADQCYMTVSWAQVYNSSRWRNFLKLSRWPVIGFHLIAGLGLFFKVEFSLLSAYGKRWITSERHFLKDHSRASLLAVAKFVTGQVNHTTDRVTLTYYSLASHLVHNYAR